MALTIYPVTEIRTRNIPGGKGRPERKADHYLRADFLQNVGVSMSHNNMGLHGLLKRMPLPFTSGVDLL
jgi:hypothetical protein